MVRRWELDAGCAEVMVPCPSCSVRVIDEPTQLDADRIPQFGGSSLPWRPDRPEPVGGLEWIPLWAGVWLLCLLLTGCQFIAYQHNDYRREDKSDADPATVRRVPELLRGLLRPRPTKAQPEVEAPTFPGLLGISPGLGDLARIAGPDCWVAHSAGAARAVSLICPGRCPRVLLLIDPWPLQLEVPDGPELVIVVCGRPSVVTVGPGTRAVSKLRAAGSCPWAWTVGHLYACRWVESVEAARDARAIPSTTN